MGWKTPPRDVIFSNVKNAKITRFQSTWKINPNVSSPNVLTTNSATQKRSSRKNHQLTSTAILHINNQKIPLTRKIGVLSNKEKIPVRPTRVRLSKSSR